MSLVYRGFRIVVAILIVLGTLPFIPLVINSGFTLTATFILPTSLLGLWMALSAAEPANRVGWFVFSAVVALSLSIGPWWKITIMDLLAIAQNHVSYSVYRILEPSSFIAMLTVPWLAACLVASMVARLTVRKLDVGGQDGAERGFQFSIREMLSGFVIVALVIATLSASVKSWNLHDRSHRSRFLRRFTSSFTSGQVTLLATPILSVENRHMFQAPGVHEYRVVAPIRKNEQDRWAVWTYTAYEHVPDSVGQFGYAEATKLEELPQSGPVPEYLSQPIVQMTDGEPVFKWPKAELLEYSRRLTPGGTISVVAKAKWGAQCELRVHPFHAVLPPAPAIKTAPQNDVMRWDWKLDPKFRGKTVEIEILSRLGQLYRPSSVKKTITIEPWDDTHRREPFEARRN